MSATIASISSRTVKTYTVRVGGAPEQKMRYSSYRYVPDTVTVEKSDGNVRRVELSGRRVLKDGSLGQQQCSETMWDRGQMPDWLPSIIGGLA